MGLCLSLDGNILRSLNKIYAPTPRILNLLNGMLLIFQRPSPLGLLHDPGRYSRPFKKAAERTCPICKIEMEDDYHFLNICPAYQEKRCSLLDCLEKELRDRKPVPCFYRVIETRVEV